MKVAAGRDVVVIMNGGAVATFSSTLCPSADIDSEKANPEIVGKANVTKLPEIVPPGSLRIVMAPACGT